MAKIAFLLLCHKRADRVLEQARVLTALGDCVAIHIDGNAKPEFAKSLQDGLAGNPNVVFADRVECGWGEWSLVQATLNMIIAAEKTFVDASHFFLMSGDCMPIKPAHHIRSHLDSADIDHIEHADFYEDNWIKTGMKEDRLIYRHWFNERRQKEWFYRALNLQRKLGLRRDIPHGIRMRIGSQWWVLRRETIEKILAFTKGRKDVMRFFRTTWIPDETFFQTVVMNLVPKEQVNGEPPTFLMFTDYGMPLTFYGDHYGFLRGQKQLFARKISDNSDQLRAALGDLFVSDEVIENTENTGRKLYDYVRQRGRIGRRFADRIWESGATLGPDYTLILIVCKKWHIANRIAESVAEYSQLPAYGYVFDEENLHLPDLGGIENSSEKRARHRRAVLKLIYQHHDTSHLAICIDPANIDAINDFRRDGCHLKILEIACELDADWLAGHARRIGLGQATEVSDLHEGVLLTLRQNINDERRDLRDMRLPEHRTIQEGDTPGKMARILAEIFNVPIDTGARIARTKGLFD